MSRKNNQELLQLHPGLLLLLLSVTPAQLTRTEPSQEQESPEQVHVKIPQKEVSMKTNCPNSQQLLKEQCSPEPVPLLTAHWEALGRKNIIWDLKWGWNFYFRMKGLRKACSLSNTSNAQLKGTSLTEFPLPWEMGSEFPPLGHVSLSPLAPEQGASPGHLMQHSERPQKST